MTKEVITAVVILVFLFAREVGIVLSEDLKLQVLLVVTLIGGALAAYSAAGQVTPVVNPQLRAGTSLTVTDAAGMRTGTTTVTPDAPPA